MSADQRRGPYITILTTTLLALSVSAAAAQATFYGPGGNYQGQATWRRNTGTFYDAKGNFIGNSVTLGRSTSFYGRDGAFEGTLGRLGNTTTFMIALAAIRVTQRQHGRRLRFEHSILRGGSEIQTAGIALPVQPDDRLAQDEEPGGAGGEARGG